MADVVLIQPTPTVKTVVPPPLNPTFPHKSQSPAVRDIDVTSLAVILTRETAEATAIVLVTNSPTLSAAALLLVVVPMIPEVLEKVKLVADAAPKTGVTKVGLVLNEIAPEPFTFAANAVATPVPYPVVPDMGKPVALVKVNEAGVPIAKLVGNVVLKLGTPPDEVTSTELFAVARADMTFADEA